MAESEIPVTRRKVDPARKLGQVGETWGNLLMDPSEMALDTPFSFEGENVLYKVTRVLPYPLDGTKRLFYYESNPQR